MRGWALSGRSREWIAGEMGVTVVTLETWAGRRHALREALDRGEAAYREVEAALQRLACGGTRTVTKHVKVKDIRYDDDGKRRETEELVAVKDEVYMPPSVQAAIFWLTQRRPDTMAQEDMEAMELRVVEAIFDGVISKAEDVPGEGEPSVELQGGGSAQREDAGRLCGADSDDGDEL